MEIRPGFFPDFGPWYGFSVPVVSYYRIVTVQEFRAAPRSLVKIDQPCISRCFWSIFFCLRGHLHLRDLMWLPYSLMVTYLFDKELESFDEKQLPFIRNEWQPGEVVGLGPQFCYPFSLFSKGMVDEWQDLLVQRSIVLLIHDLLLLVSFGDRCRLQNQTDSLRAMFFEKRKIASTKHFFVIWNGTWYEEIISS